jgi:hypothetical protein
MVHRRDGPLVWRQARLSAKRAENSLHWMRAIPKCVGNAEVGRQGPQGLEPHMLSLLKWREF